MLDLNTPAIARLAATFSFLVVLLGGLVVTGYEPDTTLGMLATGFGIGLVSGVLVGRA